jgi:oligosaccharide repeat unit polymerase
MLLLAVMMMIYSMSWKRSLLKLSLIFVLVLATATILSTLGGRKGTMVLLLMIIPTWHYGVRRIRRITWQAVLFAALITPYFVAVPILRSSGAVEHYQNSPDELWPDIIANLRTVVSDLSYVDTYLFITNYFTLENIWMGQSYLDLLLAPIPSTIYPDKPPIDDGMYVNALARGLDVTPGTAYRELQSSSWSSWPPETMGAMYMNYWLPGVVVGMYLLGALYQTAYRYLRLCNYSLFSIYVYTHLLLNFHWSNLRIVQAIVNIAIAGIFFSAFFGLRSGTKRELVSISEEGCSRLGARFLV